MRTPESPTNRNDITRHTNNQVDDADYIVEVTHYVYEFVNFNSPEDGYRSRTRCEAWKFSNSGSPHFSIIKSILVP